MSKKVNEGKIFPKQPKNPPIPNPNPKREDDDREILRG
jgi:hypothetical protein